MSACLPAYSWAIQTLGDADRSLCWLYLGNYRPMRYSQCHMVIYNEGKSRASGVWELETVFPDILAPWNWAVLEFSSLSYPRSVELRIKRRGLESWLRHFIAEWLGYSRQREEHTQMPVSVSKLVYSRNGRQSTWARVRGWKGSEEGLEHHTKEFGLYLEGNRDPPLNGL